MNSIFKPTLKTFVLLFFEDILIYNKSWEEHVEHVDKDLTLLEEKQLYAIPSKCVFWVQEVEYLGHIVSHNEVKVDSNKIKAIREWPTPNILNKLRGFLGLERYYYKSVNIYGQIVTPLMKLLKNEAFCWTKEATKAFEELNEDMCTTLVLATLDFTKIFIVECDVLGQGIGALLMQ